MNPQQEAHFRALLEHWRQQLMEEVDRTVDNMQEETHHHADPSDRATQESDIGIELRTRDRERKLLSKIQKTLSLIDEHEYGYCKRCGVEIGISRLEAKLPSGRMGTPDDIAKACLYLASDDAAYVSGASLEVYGGGEPPSFLSFIAESQQ